MCPIADTTAGAGMLQGNERFPPQGNRLLAAFPAASLARLAGSMTLAPMRLGEVLHESGSEIRQVYFPVSGLVSLMKTLEGGATAEVAVVGSEGCIGSVLLLSGTGPSLRRAVVQVAGYAYQARAGGILAEFDRGGTAQRLLLRYVQALMTQMSQAAVCNRHHTVEQRLCRWLLQRLDRVSLSDLYVTQELIGSMLGVRRSGVAHAVRNLQDAGIIKYRRGLVAVPDRAKLEAHACECYAVVRKETDRLLRLPFEDAAARGG